MTRPSNHTSPESVRFAALASWVLRLRIPLLVLSLSTTAFLGYQAATHRKVDAGVDAFLANDSQPFRILENLRDDFGRDELFVVLVKGDVFTLPYLEQLRTLHRELSALDLPLASLGTRKRAAGSDKPPPEPLTTAAEGFEDFEDFAAGWGDEAGGSVVDEVVSLVNARETTYRDGSLRVGGLLDTWPTADGLPDLQQRVLRDRTLVGRVVDAHGQYSALAVRTAFMNEEDSQRVHQALERIAADHRTPGFEPHVAGLPALSSEITRLTLTDLGRLGGLGMLLIVLAMALMFRHPLGVLGPVMVVAQAVIWTLGAMSLAGVPITMITNILPVFVICVGIGDSVHVQSVYRDQRAAGVDNRAAIVQAVASTGLPVLFTSLTTAAGLLSFQFATVDAIQELGLFGALGVVLALAHSLIFLPIVLSFNAHSTLGKRAGHSDEARDGIDRVLAFCSGLSRPDPRGIGSHRLRRTLIGAALLGAFAISGAALTRVHHNPLTWLPDELPARRAIELTDRHLGGTADMTLLIEAAPGESLRDRDLMLGLEKLERHIAAYRHPEAGPVVGNIVSLLDVVRESNRAVHELDPAHFGVPESQRGVVDMLTLFENAGPEELKRLATVDMRRALMVVRLPSLDASSYGPLVGYVRAGIQRHVGGLATVRVTGSAVNLLTVVDSLIRDLLRSFGAAFVVITLMMVLLLRDLRLGLVAMVPNLLPILTMIGLMGVVGIPLDLSNILMGSIAIGVAVDDTIHFLHQFQAHFRKHGKVEAALDHSFSHAGRAMVMTSLVLVGGFLIYSAAQIASLRVFGQLVALALGLALAIDLIVTPALLRGLFAGASEEEEAPDRAGSQVHGSHGATTT